MSPGLSGKSESRFNSPLRQLVVTSSTRSFPQKPEESGYYERFGAGNRQSLERTMYRSRVIGPLHRYFWHFKLTAAGRGAVLAMLLAAAGSITVEIPIYQIFCGLMALLFVTDPLGILLRPTVELSGRLPERARCGEPLTGVFTISNHSRKPVFDLMLGMFDLPREITMLDADRYVPTLRRHDAVEFPLTLMASRRGVYRLPPVHAHWTFPFNLMRFGGSKLASQSLTVLPAYHALDRIEIPHSLRYQPGGEASTPPG